MEITTVGLDLAKHVFQVHAVAADGTVVLRKAAAARPGVRLLCRADALSGGRGGLRHGALLGARAS